MRARFISLQLDAVGFFASILCALHCALLPFLVVLLPFAELDFLLGPGAELALVGVSLIIAFASVVGSFHRHKRKRVPLAMLLGFSCILYGILAAPSAALEILCTSTGGVLVALGHYLSWRYLHRH